MLTPIHVISDGDTKVFCRLNIFQILGVKGMVKEYLFVMLDAESLSWSDIINQMTNFTAYDQVLLCFLAE